MPLRIPDANEPKPSEITPESVWRGRRDILATAGHAIALSAFPAAGFATSSSGAGAPEDPRTPVWLRQKLSARKASPTTAPGEPLTPFSDVSSYNNFYEFGTGKDDPANEARDFVVSPWRVRIDGEVGKPGDYTLEDIVGPHVLEERIYRFRCVEAWSMVVPWVGFPLAALLRRFEPTSRAKYVAFQTLHDPARMPGQRSRWLRWPYVEGLRIDEAMHPLTLISVGVYGRSLPPQNGAPLRLVVPWKYGFKSIKSIVRISLTEKLPRTTWAEMAPAEYGFYANVNPAVDHPRWSQARERRLPTGFFAPNWIPTRPFNGYEDQVASLYRGMDLQRSF